MPHAAASFQNKLCTVSLCGASFALLSACLASPLPYTKRSFCSQLVNFVFKLSFESFIVYSVKFLLKNKQN